MEEAVFVSMEDVSRIANHVGAARFVTMVHENLNADCVRGARFAVMGDENRNANLVAVILFAQFVALTLSVKEARSVPLANPHPVHVPDAVRSDLLQL